MGANWPALPSRWGFALDRGHLQGVGSHIQPTVLLLDQFFLFKDVEKKIELKSPKTPHPWETQHMPSPPPKNAGISILPAPTSPNQCGWGGGPGVIALATRELSAPIVPIAQLLHVEFAHNLQSPGIPSHTQVREPQSAMRHQEQPPVQGVEVPAVQWRPWTRVANPGIPGKGANVARSLDKWRSNSGRSHL